MMPNPINDFPADQAPRKHPLLGGFRQGFVYTQTDLIDFLICFCIIASFFARLYPAAFVITTCVITWKTKRITRAPWFIWLFLYTVYALGTYLHVHTGSQGATLNLIKLFINLALFAQVILWFELTPHIDRLRRLDITLTIVMALTYLQLFVYHAVTGFSQLRVTNTSSTASMLYEPIYSFFGPADKNIFGAKLAVCGFLYLLARWIRTETFPWLRAIVLLFGAFASLSRTPLVALFAGIIAMLLVQTRNIWVKLAVIGSIIAVLPSFLVSIVRVNSFNEMSDGFAIRLIYWAAFFTHLDAISLWGNGFLSATTFLQSYAVYYNGEPQLHNLFLNTYLDFGVIGLLSFSLFFISFVARGVRIVSSSKYWVVALVPIIGIMLTLYVGYESDFVIYLFCIYAFARSAASSPLFASRVKKIPLRQPRRRNRWQFLLHRA